ncbi:MAG: hypothetical protein CFE26_26360 [Verrucomicrobiales bacterium VVV1]|nr:MAG: hypothetical protein CFE26_26360 [Verrucomicrobiales bacterium VVV1]
MELTTSAGTVGEQGFEEADVGGDNNGGVPVFGGEAVVFSLVLRIELGVVFENDVAPEFFGELSEDGPKDVGVLFDDAGKGDNEDNAAVADLQRVADSE